MSLGCPGLPPPVNSACPSPSTQLYGTALESGRHHVRNTGAPHASSCPGHLPGPCPAQGWPGSGQGCPRPGVTGQCPLSTPGVVAWREQRADGRAGRADNPLIPSTPRGLSRAELGHGGHSSTGAPPAPAAFPGGTWGPAGLGADWERGWVGRVCWAGLGSSAGPLGSPLTMPLPSSAAVVTGSACPRARVSSTRSCTSWPLLCAASCCPALWPRLSQRR